MKEGIYLIEPGKLTSVFKIKNIFVKEKTQFQELWFVELEGFGRSLVIDDFIQSTEADEYIYHESLVHPAMLLSKEPEKVLIIGGGEGATLREVLKHNTVKEAVMVDIDAKVIEFSKKYLKHMHQNSFSDPRTSLVISDGYDYVKKSNKEYFDVVVLDLPDPYADGAAEKLYETEFYRNVKEIMKKDGIVVTQAGSSFFYESDFKKVKKNMKSVFENVKDYSIYVPSFSSDVCFVMGSDYFKTFDIPPEKFEKKVKERKISSLRFLNKSTYTSIINSLPLKSIY